MGIYFNLSVWYKLTAQTWWGAVMSATGCAVMVAVNVLFVPRMGYMACAWGGLAGYGVCVLLSYSIGQRHYKVPYPVASLSAYFALALVLYAVGELVHIEGMIPRLLFRTALVLAYVAVVVWKEKALFSRAIHKISHR